MRHRVGFVPLAFAVALVTVLFGPASAQADSFTFTSGQLYSPAPPAGITSFKFTGDGVFVAGVIMSGGWFPDLTACAFNCPGETSVNLGTVLGAPYGPLGYGSATINGVTYRNPTAPDVFFGGTLTFDAPSITLAGGVDSYSAPFTFTGRVQGFGSADRTGSPLFDIAANGEGDAYLRMVYDAQTNRYSFLTMSYLFTNTATAVTPEPASMILLGSGTALTGFLARRRRRRDARAPN